MRKNLFMLLVSFISLGIANPISNAEMEIGHQDTEGELVTNGNPTSNGSISLNEHKIVTELENGTVMNGKKLAFTVTEMTAVKNYLKRVDLSTTQINEAIENIQMARNLFEKQSISISGNETIHAVVRQFPHDVIYKLEEYVINAGKSVGIKVTFDTKGVATMLEEGSMTLTDKDGYTVYQSGRVIKTTGIDYLPSFIGICLLVIFSFGAVVISKKSIWFGKNEKTT
ncbi:hypothetical protein [Carnobacterium maltaromaticum]|uniref:hypothetical protein n=1 Tax=Carnobacterium maltaromaticum TaxID=2751 RepID=UPI0039AEA527